jgi:hypothetical protein
MSLFLQIEKQKTYLLRYLLGRISICKTYLIYILLKLGLVGIYSRYFLNIFCMPL